MTTLFCIIVFLIGFYELHFLINCKRNLLRMARINASLEVTPDLSKLPKEDRSWTTGETLIGILYWIIDVLGIFFSTYRIWFGVIFCMAMLCYVIHKYIFKGTSKGYIIVKWLDCLISAIILFGIVIAYLSHVQ